MKTLIVEFFRDFYVSLGEFQRIVLQSHHDSCQQTNSLPAVGVRDHVTVADGQEGDGDQPHGAKESTGYLVCIVVPAQW